ncbi:RecA-like domain-containing protein [Phanerochaete sordida]|uniref:RecA-like domain-containing protein n=1 Tax=Phanerochaete sordida TaxID=48140 RepID=A0A9P3L9I7_9APHY|nr:RecA-like domain-containing protein [Phanerochaete sordida]
MDPVFDITADSLLQEIQHESLQTLLLSVRHGTLESEHASSLRREENRDLPPPGEDPPIDGEAPQLDPAPPMRPLLSRGNLIELQGSSGSGKSHLVYAAIVTCILPQHHAQLDLDGWDQAAVVLDTDESFDLRRVCQLLDARIHAAVAKDPMVDDSDIAAIRDESLRNLHVFYPQSSIQLATTLLALPSYHWNEPHIQHREMGLVVVDSLSTFYWEDRYTVEQLRSGQKSSGVDIRTPFRHVISALEDLMSTHRPLMLVTNWGLSPLNKDAAHSEDAPYFRQHLYPMPPGFGEPEPVESVTQLAPTMSEFRQTLPPESSTVEPSHPRGPSRTLATLPLTHHITLLRKLDEPGMYNDTLLTGGSSVFSSRGIIRTRNGGSAEFSFGIRDDRVVVEPGDIFQH